MGKSPMQHIQDGWKNIVSGLGILGRDKTKSNGVDNIRRLIPLELFNLYGGEGLATKIIDLKPEDMLRNGWQIDQDADGALEKEVDRLKLKDAVERAVKWARLFGGSILVTMYEGSGGLLEEPLKLGYNNPKVIGFKVYPSPRIELMDSDFITDPTSPMFEDVNQFRVQSRTGGEIRIHRSRCQVFHGLEMPDILTANVDYKERYFGHPILTAMFPHVSNLGTFLQGIGALGTEFSTTIMKLSNLAELVAESNYADILKRAEVIAATRSIINATVIGEGEDITRQNITFTGIPDVIQELKSVVAGVAGYPVTRLFGTSAKGLNATGEGDNIAYYDSVKSEQDSALLFPVTTIINQINQGIKIIPNKELTITFNPIWTPSEEALIEMRHKQAQTDKIYHEMDALYSYEIRTNRFENGYSFNTTIESDAQPPNNENK